PDDLYPFHAGPKPCPGLPPLSIRRGSDVDGDDGGERVDRVLRDGDGDLAERIGAEQGVEDRRPAPPLERLPAAEHPPRRHAPDREAADRDLLVWTHHELQ